jgi:hypothetical protein
MKEGAVAETGTHEELMSKGGEYAGLYKIQADAFLLQKPVSVEMSEGDQLEVAAVSHSQNHLTRKLCTNLTIFWVIVRIDRLNCGSDTPYRYHQI